ncbi:MAG TPA: winged helix-turn-helix transcriptional regulator, partial [bacterium]|nr:winged helix-turn-helix transcriptional regulator [bacterium]
WRFSRGWGKSTATASASQLSKMTGASVPTVKRILKRFQKDGIIRLEQKQEGLVSVYMIEDPSKWYHGDTGITVTPVSGRHTTGITVIPDQYQDDTATGITVIPIKEMKETTEIKESSAGDFSHNESWTQEQAILQADFRVRDGTTRITREQYEQMKRKHGKDTTIQQFIRMRDKFRDSPKDRPARKNFRKYVDGWFSNIGGPA